MPDLRALSFGDALDHCNLISGAEVVYEHIVHEHEIQELDAPSVCKQPCLGNLQSVQSTCGTLKIFARYGEMQLWHG